MAEKLATEGLSILAPAQVLGYWIPPTATAITPASKAGGSAGCAASEDFFPSPGNPEDRNPNYHKVSDRVFDLPFATSIARVICAAALRAAHPAVPTAFAAGAGFATPAGIAERVSGRVVVAGGQPPAGRSHRLAARRRSAGTEIRGPGRSRSGRHLRRRDPARVLSSPRASCRRRLAGVDARDAAGRRGRQAGAASADGRAPAAGDGRRTGQSALRTLCRHDVERRGGFGGHARRRARSCQGDDRSRLGAVRRTLPHRERRSGAVTGLRRRSDADAMRNRTPPGRSKNWPTCRATSIRRSSS